MIVDPRNPDVVFVAALGTCYGPQPERGVYRTTDGGKTWERVLFVDENTGASDLAMDPTNPRILFAGTWQIDIKTWGTEERRPRQRRLRLARRRHDLEADHGARPARSAARQDRRRGRRQSNPQRVYALIETGDRGSLWRSDDGGEEWKLVNHSRLLNERPHYYTRMLVMPDNANEVYFPVERRWA